MEQQDILSKLLVTLGSLSDKLSMLEAMFQTVITKNIIDIARSFEMEKQVWIIDVKLYTNI